MTDTENTNPAEEPTPESISAAQRAPSKAARYGLIIAIISAILALLAGPAFQLGLLPLQPALFLVPIGLLGSVIAVILSFIALVKIGRNKPQISGMGRALGALAIGAVMVAVVGVSLLSGMQKPAIHDITTDTQDPPEFIALVPARTEAPNEVDYAGEDIAIQQREAYPQIETVTFDAPKTQVMESAAQVVRDMGWEIADISPAAGRIEATDTTLFFGFKDDVVIRVSETDGKTRVDMRSASRVGLSDLGANAARIDSFMSALNQQMGDQ